MSSESSICKCLGNIDTTPSCQISFDFNAVSPVRQNLVECCTTPCERTRQIASNVERLSQFCEAVKLLEWDPSSTDTL